MTDMVNFDVATWEARCESLQAMAHAGCGLSYDLYQQRFSAAVEEHIVGLPGEMKSLAISVAVPFGYLAAGELAQVQIELAECGYCTHGIDPNCCPLGCGDIDHDDPEEPWQEPHPEVDEFDLLLEEVLCKLRLGAERFDRKLADALAPLKGRGIASSDLPAR